MHPSIAQYRQAISAMCERHHIRRMQVFGSGARAHDFDPATGDADFLVEFVPAVRIGLVEFFKAKQDLEYLPGRGVDLIDPSAIQNPYLLASINAHRELEYAA